MRFFARTLPLLAASLSLAVAEEELGALVADRSKIERVYYAHRLGTKPPFDEAIPPAEIERMVQIERKKEAVLARVYQIEITPAMVAAEVQRIDATTRAPEVLAEIKHALGDDAARFASAMARPLVVERELRSRFENDDALHAPQRRQAEATRNELLAARTQGANAARLLALLKQSHADAVTETTWQLSARPEEKPGILTAEESEICKRFGPAAQILTTPSTGVPREQKHYFDDVPGELQTVLKAQLRHAGDVSAVIETPAGFLLFLATEKSATTLGVASLSLPKRSYEEWLAQQPETGTD